MNDELEKLMEELNTDLNHLDERLAEIRSKQAQHRRVLARLHQLLPHRFPPQGIESAQEDALDEDTERLHDKWRKQK